MLRHLFILFLIISLAIPGKAQIPDPLLINETYHNVGLITAIKSLKRNYNLKFAYDHKLVTNIKVNVIIQNETDTCT